MSTGVAASHGICIVGDAIEVILRISRLRYPTTGSRSPYYPFFPLEERVLVEGCFVGG